MLFLDTETTGVTCNDEILSLAIIDDEGTVLMDHYFTPVKNRSWAQAEKIHGITPQFIAKGNFPTLAEYALDIWDILNGQCICAYNIEFDLPMLERGTGHYYDATKFCAMNAYAELKGIPSTKPYHKGYLPVKLSVAAKETGHKWTGKAHGALADTRACKHVWEWCVEKDRQLCEIAQAYLDQPTKDPMKATPGQWQETGLGSGPVFI